MGVVLAAIMPIPEWERHYSELLDCRRLALDFDCDLTVEVITHRFTPGSKDVLLQWYPSTSLDLAEEGRAASRPPRCSIGRGACGASKAVAAATRNAARVIGRCGRLRVAAWESASAPTR